MVRRVRRLEHAAGSHLSFARARSEAAGAEYAEQCTASRWLRAVTGIRNYRQICSDDVHSP
jgi:hypothetical protein